MTASYFLGNNKTWFGDAPSGLYKKFQDPATTVMEGIFEFNLHLLFITICIVGIVSWILKTVLANFLESSLSGQLKKKFVHSNPIEIIWTVAPASTLLCLSYPSFALLYGLDDGSSPSLTLKIIGCQWYWDYENHDYMTCLGSNHELKFSSYMLSNEYLIENTSLGLLRNLETNKRVVLPEKTNIRLLITAIDVLHSWTIPSFGIKVDACPGRLNECHTFIKRSGIFFGQCSEICGINHGFMPIVVLIVSSEKYRNAVLSSLQPV